MAKHLLKTFMAVLAIAASAIAPAWGQNETLLTTVTATGQSSYSQSPDGIVTVTLNNIIDYGDDYGWAWDGTVTVEAAQGYTITRCVFRQGPKDPLEDDLAPFTATMTDANDDIVSVETSTGHVNGDAVTMFGITSIEVYGYKIPTYINAQLAAGTEEAANWTLASGNASVPGTQVLEGVLAGSTLTATYNGDLKVKEVIATKHQEPTPLTIEALTAGIVMVQQPKSGMQYTLNGGPKTAMTEYPTEITVAVGDKVAFYGNGTSITSYDGTGITGGTAEVKAYGNIMSLVNETGFDTATTLTTNGAFYYLFQDYANLKDISGLKLPATTLTVGCYMGMFSYCTGLTTVPSDLLPATTMARRCYRRMFMGCENLTNVPTLPATTLAMECYDNMFSRCTGLTTVPTDLLPATTLAELCYSSMFYFCQNLTTAPVLPATTLVEGCYNQMFANCLNLSSVTCLATSGIDQNNYCTVSWLYGAGEVVQGTKIFNAASSANWPMGDNGIPNGWTVVNVPNN